MGEGIEIEDYKTGDIHEVEQFQESNRPLKSRYRRQLLLYAAMHHSETGDWPVAGHVVPLTGERESIRIDPTEAKQEADAALELLEKFNTQVTQRGSPESLASPSRDTCRFCSYKAFCEPFWEQVLPGWDWLRNVTIEGMIQQIYIGRTGSWTIEVNVRRGNIEKGIYTISGDRPTALKESQHLRAINLISLGPEANHTLLVTDYTELWTKDLIDAITA